MLRLLNRSEHLTQSGLGQGVRYVENLVATPGQFVTDRGGIDLSARHFELGECHQYVHCVVTR